MASGYLLIIGTIVPFIMIISCNIWIINTVRSAAERRKALGTARKETQKQQEKETQYLTRMLILVSIAYVVTSIPLRLYYFIMDLPYFDNMYDMEQLYWNLRFNVQNWSITVVWFFNYAVNFFLYCAGGGKRYRQDALEILQRIFKCKCN